MAKTWAQRQIESGVKLELTPYPARNCWKKYLGKVRYLKHPLSKVGYEAALLEWAQIRASLDNERPNADIFQHHTKVFKSVKTYFEQFGVPQSERKLAQQVDYLLDWIDECLLMPQIPVPIELVRIVATQPELFAELHSSVSTLSTIKFELPDKWLDRIERLSEKIYVKEPQNIGHWVEKYLERVDRRKGKFITKKSADDRRFKLKHFIEHRDMHDHIATIDDTYLEQYHHDLDEYVSPQTGKEIGRHTKIDYFAVFRMFVRWASKNSNCELIPPANLDSKEFGFREPKGTGRRRQEKKFQLWTPEEFTDAVNKLPCPYNCYVVLMLNCGFRHVDLSELRWEDWHQDKNRIVIQRNKLNQQDSAPVVSYKLWDHTIQVLEQAKSRHPEFIFVNSRGGQVEGSIKIWWKRNKKKYGGKRLDYIRKTGSTEIANHDRTLDELYLGEALSTTARIHYSFTDGEPCEALDGGLAHLGAKFGFCDLPAKTITLTPELLKKLTAAGIEV